MSSRPVYSTRFFSATLSPGGSPGSYTVPAGFVAVLRDVWVYLGNSAFLTSWYLQSGTGAKMWAAEAPPLTPQFWFWQGRQVYEAGEAIELVNNGSSSVDASASGYLLTLP